MLTTDEIGTKVKTKYRSILPKGIICTVMDCKFVGNTTVRAYLVESETGEKMWYLDHDLQNIKTRRHPHEERK